ncbi:hypothetical protein VNO77_44332 [Canavalia gladiata]|uniref:Uncharacterized protein n=1 Tax=Canavalia gladiata TaxID=3824 RepID=A0AAN9PQX1_CANGL
MEQIYMSLAVLTNTIPLTLSPEICLKNPRLQDLRADFSNMTEPSWCLAWEMTSRPELGQRPMMISMSFYWCYVGSSHRNKGLTRLRFCRKMKFGTCVMALCKDNINFYPKPNFTGSTMLTRPTGFSITLVVSPDLLGSQIFKDINLHNDADQYVGKSLSCGDELRGGKKNPSLMEIAILFSQNPWQSQAYVGDIHMIFS